MSNKKKGLTHSQTLGIIWLSITLLLIVAVIIFYHSRGSEQSTNRITDSTDISILEQNEDSIYASLRKSSTTNRTPISSYKKQHSYNQHKLDTTYYSATPSTAKRQPLVIELNTADTLTLQLLHGIGPAYAHRIVRYRERLGGFHSIEQLLEVYGFTPELLAHISPHLTLDTTAIQRIPINTIELKQLIKHPYIEYYQARDIVKLRKSGVCFLSDDDLRAVPSMADSTLARLLPYIDFGPSAE